MLKISDLNAYPEGQQSAVRVQCTPYSMNGLFSEFFKKGRGSFWGCSGLFGGVWETFWKENWSKICGEKPSEVPNETI